jgi:drug/metabolite transporter (DMT)-like permease
VPAAALALVLAAAVLHAAWNLLAKRSASGGLPVAWLVSASSAAVWTPVAVGVVLFGSPRFGTAGLVWVAGSAVLHIGYFLFLQLGYRLGDLSTVYPLARGVGPLLAALGGVVLLGERPGPLGFAGALLVAGGVLVLARSGARTAATSGRSSGVGAGVLTGIFIAGYTLWDAHAVADAGISPLLYGWATTVGETTLLGTVALRSRPAVASAWREYHREVLAVAVLAPLAYLLVLIALTKAPVSAVAPARELSIVIGVVLGGRLLKEADATLRVLAAASVVAGVVFLAVS